MPRTQICKQCNIKKELILENYPKGSRICKICTNANNRSIPDCGLVEGGQERIDKWMIEYLIPSINEAIFKLKAF